MVFLLPYNTAHAAGPTVSLSTISSGVLTAATSGQVGGTIVVTGSGFLPASSIAITTTVGTAPQAWLGSTGGCTSITNGGLSSTSTPVASLVVSGCLTTTAIGNFQVEVKVPALPGGAQTIVVTDGTNSVSAAFTVTAKISFSSSNNNYGFPEQNLGTGTFTLTGFGATESVSVASTAFTTASFITTSCTTSTVGSCSFTDSNLYVADVNSGAKTITATGATSLLTASTSETITPWAAFYNSAAGATTFSFVGTAPTSLLIEVHGMAAGTIAANSVTIGGVTTNHAAVTIGATGTNGGASSQIVVSPTANVPYGSVNVVVGGITFSYQAGNIVLAYGSWGQASAGALISSIAGSSSTTGVAITDASNYKPGAVNTASTSSPAPLQNQMAFFGYGFVNAAGSGSTLSIATPAGVAWVSPPSFNTGNGGGSTHADANGAFFAVASLDNTPWSASATPTTAASYTPTVAQVATAPANILSPSFGITPWIDTTSGAIQVNSSSSSTVDYRSGVSFKVHGLGSTSDTATFTIGGAAFAVGTGTCTLTNGACTLSTGTKVPDLAKGAQNVAATDSTIGQTATASGAVTYVQRVDSSSSTAALSINQGGAGQTTIVRTGNGYGVHGLTANTAYNIIWNAISGAATLGTFTTTATGGIPIPGVQVTIPSDASGVHILDIQTAAGASAVFGSLKAGQLTPAESISPALFPNSVYTSAYGDLLFSNIALLQAAPSVALIGSPETLSGTGLAAGTTYIVALGSGAGTVSLSAPALSTFTSTASGSVPSGSSITLADTATKLETGTVDYLSVQTAAHFGVSGSSDAYAQFVLAASANLNMTSAPAAHPVTVTAHALNNAGAVYSIIFNYLQSPIQSTSYTGTPVGVIAPNSVGAGSAVFNVPATATSGTYVVQLVVSSQGTNGAPVGTAVLDSPLSLTVGSVATSCNTTSCLAATGASSVTQIGSNKAIQTTFTNNSNAPATAIVYAVVHNALGQTVSYTTATITMNAGGSATAYDVLFGLAPGTYSVTIFATSTSGTAISGTSTVSVTI